MGPTRRRAFGTILSAILIVACGSATGDDPKEAARSASAITSKTGMVLGAPDAPVTLIEYASVTCGHCAQFHNEVLPAIKRDYVDTGKLKFVFREFPTPPANLAVAGFAIARCAGPEAYFDVLDDIFEAQPGILQAARQGAARPALEAIAERHGIAGKEAFEACLNDSEIRSAIADTVMSGEKFDVSATPTLILEGRKLEQNQRSRTPEGLSELIDAELAALGIANDKQAGTADDIDTTAAQSDRPAASAPSDETAPQ